MDLSAPAKAKYYEDWTGDSNIGGVLGRYMDKGQVRVYIKDSLMKGYARSRLADPTRILRVLGVDSEVEQVESYVKPHGKRLADNRVICWGRAEAWKNILMATYERAYACQQAVPHAAVLLQAVGRFGQDATRRMVETAARKLGIEHIVWLDT
jgi:hypothetical protein